MSLGIDETVRFIPVTIAILIVSDTRTLETDTSGAILAERIEKAGHKVFERRIITDDIPEIQNIVSSYLAHPEVDVVISSGGTGLTGRDVTVEAVKPMMDKIIDGFSVIFHQVSFQTIGLSTLQSRAFAGLAKNTFVFCLPGSTGAVKDGWDKVICAQLDNRHRPCNMVELMPRLSET